MIYNTLTICMSTTQNIIIITTEKDSYTISSTNIGKGVDGEVFPATTKNGHHIVVKIIPLNSFSNKEEYTQFKDMHLYASNSKLHPTIYDFFEDEINSYMFMDALDGTLLDYVRKLKQNWESVKEEIKQIVTPIHNTMFELGITLGDDNMENYMFKGTKWYRIDFTASIRKKGNKKNYQHFSYLNIYTNQLEKIRLF